MSDDVAYIVPIAATMPRKKIIATTTAARIILN
jgi:hypothetical protein